MGWGVVKVGEGGRVSCGWIMMAFLEVSGRRCDWKDKKGLLYRIFEFVFVGVRMFFFGCLEVMDFWRKDYYNLGCVFER